MTKIISAARQTGKSSFIKQFQTNEIVVVPSSNFIRDTDYKSTITAAELHRSLTGLGGYIDFGIRARDQRYIFEEPALYDEVFFKCLKLLPKDSITLVIGTPVSGNHNLFDWYLEWNRDKVITWSLNGDNRNKHMGLAPNELFGTWK